MAAFNDAGARNGRTLTATGAVRTAGIFVSGALVVGIGVWGYQLVMRSVNGIPVVRAAEGPMRVAPSEPGGEIAPHVGLSINAIAGQGGASAPEDSAMLMLAPEAEGLMPEDLSAEPGAEAGEVVAAGVDPNAAPPEVVAQTLTPMEVPAAAAATPAPEAAPAPVLDATSLSSEDILALADDIAGDAAPLTAVEEGTTAEVKTAINGVDTEFIKDIIPSSVPGVSESLRPTVRPARIAAVASITAPPAPAANVPTDASVNTEEFSTGTNLVQLGAFDTPEMAANEWVKFNQKFPDYMAGKERVIQQAERAGRTFYRLRAMNFDDINDARRFCAALTAESTDCVPVVVR